MLFPISAPFLFFFASLLLSQFSTSSSEVAAEHAAYRALGGFFSLSLSHTPPGLLRWEPGLPFFFSAPRALLSSHRISLGIKARTPTTPGPVFRLSFSRLPRSAGQSMSCLNPGARHRETVPDSAAIDCLGFPP